MNRISMKVKRTHPDAQIPTQGKPTDSGYDVVAIDDGVWSEDGRYIEYDTGIAVELPIGYHLKISARSSVSKYDLVLCNGEGLIDCVPEGTFIKTPDGDKLIEDIFSSIDKTNILSFNEEEWQVEEDSITDMWIKEDVQLYEIETEENDNIKIPANKLLYTKDGWKMLKDIKEGEEILKF